MGIKTTVGQIMVWLTFIFGLAYTVFSAGLYVQNELDLLKVVERVFFGLFLTVALTGILHELVGWTSKMNNSSLKNIIQQSEISSSSSKKDDSQSV
jgi:hypothetical protein